MRLNTRCWSKERHPSYHNRSKRMKKSRRFAGAPTSAYNPEGHINRVWVRKHNGLEHATFVVDPDGTGTYCHSTIRDRRDPTIKHHYGYEVNSPKRRDLGRHFWTTPPGNEGLMDRQIKERLIELFRELCNDDTIDQQSSLHLKRKRSNMRSIKKSKSTISRRSPTRRSPSRRSPTRSRSRSRSRSR